MASFSASKKVVTHLRPEKSEVIVNPVDGHGVPVLAQRSEAELKNKVDGKEVPVPHFGVVLEWGAWHQFAEKLRAAKIKFVIEPYIRFQGKVGEQATMFFQDPSGNALEFKAFKDPSQLFRKYKN